MQEQRLAHLPGLSADDRGGDRRDLEMVGLAADALAQTEQHCGGEARHGERVSERDLEREGHDDCLGPQAAGEADDAGVLRRR